MSMSEALTQIRDDIESGETDLSNMIKEAAEGYGVDERTLRHTFLARFKSVENVLAMKAAVNKSKEAAVAREDARVESIKNAPGYVGLLARAGLVRVVRQDDGIDPDQ